ncbi:MAG: 5-dehydro-2-deoxygluconokinase [Actinomyces sp.]|jgi:5-dehydro-2-deoxygluconokinase|nr:5-dehydro-2-deoxygluconokinase [Actinomyces sp.]MCI1642047.1 5-dehydro-2-deoxygluconokinase [Actinomyces sp.]MCI1661511.1 5-dehydro-2-deoxygluconokinase [Actinomyces sp.]MCI1690826.1 5-dehydro-2-deoxygluconokinase [Actinomyces sp.]MCI1788818.1 5-dehydro-2-deoxygluconokinase [Actinomyces sp.]MCI1830106.1 5-dehydro-2-deoxygluconokinase [Actinomyces sp.]
MASPGHSPFDILTIGRSGVDIYPLDINVPLEDVKTFGKFLGGSPTNVAVAGARLGHSTAAITEVGDDPFGVFVRQEMRRLGVSDDYVTVNGEFKTPVTFCAIIPPDDFPLYFYREPSAPDLQLTPAEIPVDAVRAARIFWLTVTGLSVEPTRSAHFAALDARAKKGWTVADLDYRAMFWEDEATAHEQVERMLSQVNVAIGNREECRIAVGETDPDRAADALLERGVEIAVVKQGRHGTLAKTREERVVAPITPTPVCNGLGAGDAFGGSFCHALLEGMDLGQAAQFASAAGGIVASRLECSTAMPTAQEVSDLIGQFPEETKPTVEKR